MRLFSKVAELVFYHRTEGNSRSAARRVKPRQERSLVPPGSNVFKDTQKEPQPEVSCGYARTANDGV